MVLTNVESVHGKRIVEHYGLVQGSTIRAKHVGRDIMAGLKNIVGGELTGYTELLVEARTEATRRMVAQAEELGCGSYVREPWKRSYCSVRSESLSRCWSLGTSRAGWPKAGTTRASARGSRSSWTFPPSPGRP